MSRNGDSISLELDSATANLLTHLAEAWGISEEEVVRRALEKANTQASMTSKADRMETFKALQRSLALTSAKAAEWQDVLQNARR